MKATDLILQKNDLILPGEVVLDYPFEREDRSKLERVIVRGFGPGTRLLGLGNSNECELRCKYCHSQWGKSEDIFAILQGLPTEALTIKEYEEVIRQAKELGFTTAIIFAEGEPTSADNFWDLVRLINDYGIVPAVTTHAVLFTPELAEKAYENNLTLLAGKVFSFNPELNNEHLQIDKTELKGKVKYRMVNGRPVMEGLSYLLEHEGLRQERRIAVQTTVTRKNQEEILDIFLWTRTLGVGSYIQFMYFAGEAKRHVSDLFLEPIDVPEDFNDPKKVAELEQRRYAIARKVWELDQSLGNSYPFELSQKLPGCAMGANSLLYVTMYGRVPGCVADGQYVEIEGKVANVRDTSLSELMLGKRLIKGDCCKQGESFCHVHKRNIDEYFKRQ